ncbi:tetratricopeptide repeat protein [Prevotella sp.]|uniref:tetratricopeptide repeat protein n=1 Tax=Prevotella sp. TaxID=59823 RepID=UPI002F93E4C8
MIIENIEARQRLDEIGLAILQGDVLPCIQKIREFHRIYKDATDTSFIDSIESDYQMMLNYYRQGFTDTGRERIFQHVKSRLLTAYGNLTVNYLRHYNPIVSAAYARIAGKNIEVSTIRQQLEEFVSNIALLSLESSTQVVEKREALYSSHFEVINRTFNMIFTSPMWSESEKQDWTALILSPTVDTNDSLVIVSAVMLGCIMQFDLRKFQTLTEVYTFASDERLRQRALVGWILAMTRKDSLYPELTKLIHRLLDDEHCRQEISEVGLQMFYCMDADKDTKEIQRDIMPGLMKNSNIQSADHGFIEKEEDDIEGILHPDAHDKAMEELEKGYRRMMDMQQQGSDIYFGGFAQMKRFSFFYTLVNWFMPFYTDHPELRHIVHKLPNTQVLDAFIKDNPFCDSDKYSFTLALSSVIDKLPKNILDMLERGELRQGMAFMNGQQTATPRYIRQIYLQDLYRFFRLFVQKEGLPRFFSANRLQGVSTQPSDAAFFIDHPAFDGIGMDELKKVYLRFFMKRRMWPELERVADSFAVKTSLDYLVAQVSILMNDKDEEKRKHAEPLLRQILQSEPNHAYALRMLGKIYREQGNYKVAVLIYKQLVELFPDKHSYLFHLCRCMVESNDDKARQTIFELIYKYPADINGSRLLAWDYLRMGETRKALVEYEKIMERDEAGRADCVNMGYCHWFEGHIEQALSSFMQAVSGSSVKRVIQSLNEDSALIARFIQSETDILLMKDLIRMSAGE